MVIILLNWRDKGHPKSGGAEIVTFEHTKRWVQLGHRVIWITSSYRKAKSDETIEGIRFIRRFGPLTVFFYIVWYLVTKMDSYDIVVEEIHGVPYFAPLFTKKPVIAFIHEVAGDIWDYMYPFPLNRIGKSLESLFFRLYKRNYFWTDAASTVSELVDRGIPKQLCRAIPCPITVSDRAIVTKAQKLEKTTHPSFVFASRLVKMKGIEEVIKAFSFIRTELPTATLTIIGGGEPSYIASLQNMVSEYGCSGAVIFAGRVSEREKFILMATSHILLHASVKEGWGLVVLEAAAVGTPAIVYDVSGLRDIVKDRKTGIVVHANSPRDMAYEAIALYKDNRRYAIYRKNAMQWEHSLRWDTVAKDSLSLITAAVGRHHE